MPSLNAHTTNPVLMNSWPTTDVSHWKNRAALLYILTAAAPALYIAPLLLACMVLLAGFEFLHMRSPVASAPYVSALSAWLVYLIATGLASGVPLLDFLSYQAVRYDANVLYSMVPLLVLGTGTLRLQTIDAWISVASVVSVALYLLTPLSGVYLFESHNAAGGYFMVLLAYLAGRALIDGLRGRRLVIALTLVGLVASDSRGSILAVITAVSWCVLRKRHPRMTLVVAGTTLLILLAGMAYSHRIWVENGSLFLYDYLEFGTVSAELSLDEFAFGERPGTVVHRLLFLYPMAIELFLQSPWIGVGFTRFDDFPLHLVGWSGLLVFNHSPEIQHTNLHAHNSYLHLAAETGIIGLWLLWGLVSAVYRSFRNTPRLSTAASVVVGSLLFASMTEHRLTTPSQAAPVFILVGLFWACRRTSERTARATPPRHS